jgi:hypothetical protein
MWRWCFGCQVHANQQWKMHKNQNINCQKIQKNIIYISGHSMFSQKKYYFMWLVWKDKKSWILLLEYQNLSFLHGIYKKKSQKICANIKCTDVRAIFFFLICCHFDICFQTIGSYAPGRRIAFGLMDEIILRQARRVMLSPQGGAACHGATDAGRKSSMGSTVLTEGPQEKDHRCRHPQNRWFIWRRWWDG